MADEKNDKAMAERMGEKKSSFTTAEILSQTETAKGLPDYYSNKKNYMPTKKIVGQKVEIREENRSIIKGK